MRTYLSSILITGLLVAQGATAQNEPIVIDDGTAKKKSATPGDIVVEKKKWDSLTSEDRKMIEGILRSSKLVQPQQKIVPSDTTMTPYFLNIPDPRKEVCKLACDGALGAALIGCAGLSGGTAIVVCQAGAVVARDACKNGC